MKYLDCFSKEFNLNPLRKRESVMVFEKIRNMMELCASKASPELDDGVKKPEEGTQLTGLEV